MLAFDSSPPPPHEENVKATAHGNESYLALVWRRLRRLTVEMSPGGVLPSSRR